MNVRYSSSECRMTFCHDSTSLTPAARDYTPGARKHNWSVRPAIARECKAEPSAWGYSAMVGDGFQPPSAPTSPTSSKRPTSNTCWRMTWKKPSQLASSRGEHGHVRECTRGQRLNRHEPRELHIQVLVGSRWIKQGAVPQPRLINPDREVYVLVLRPACHGATLDDVRSPLGDPGLSRQQQ